MSQIVAFKCSAPSHCAVCWLVLIFFDIIIQFVSQVLSTAPNCQVLWHASRLALPNLAPPPHTSVSRLVGITEGTCFLSQHHLCQVRPALIPVNTAGAPEQKGMQMFGLAPLGAHIKSATLRLAGRPDSYNTGRLLPLALNWVLRLSAVIHLYRCPFEIHAEGKISSRRTRCPLLNLFKDLWSSGGEDLFFISLFWSY